MPFTQENPYTYLEAKRVLGLLMSEARQRRNLESSLGADLATGGRSSITGEKADGVWDFLWLQRAQGKDSFTKYPHLTLALERDRAVVQVTVPDGLDRSLRRILISNGYQGFKTMVGDFLDLIRPLLLTDKGAKPFIMLLQRHYPSQRSIPIRDAVLEFDPRTAFGDSENGIKHQEEWLKAAFDTFAGRKSNLQLGIGVKFAYKDSSAVHTPKFVDHVEATWVACGPLLHSLQLLP